MSLSSSSNSTLPYSADGGRYSTHDTLALLVIGFSVTAACVLIIVLCDCLCFRPRRIVYVGPRRPFFVVRREAGGGGLSPNAVASLPSFSYHRGVAGGGGGGGEDGRGEGSGSRGRGGWAQCAVCLSLLQEGETVRQLPACMHLFHVACIDLWLRSHSTCPLCRATVEAPPSKDRQLVPPV
ncbi:E3 ubiquitin-protein ligase EL5 [Brachypodium distachyon]|uniref:RING-type E3 ubiquitin transferase n=1 Tax=Brachypodium distachyon TaxID=15368 RepID=A0A0Q3F7Q6_BRADI|nr:E3 ubiquitin-protein ligase EL5 [Brachypodium distachyon]KQJ94244.1 hypothetical protein BRADI_3g09416v3 [Brachypodium distachyon]|eukprot:XP_010236350.1 E3 ubiquitin-protein ligase EL5 [Brachypodium distachyon]